MHEMTVFLIACVILPGTAFVVWANSELKHFVTRFSCQVFRGEMGLAAIGVCLSMAKQQCEKVNNRINNYRLRP